jgi:hypothetical protein
MALKRPRGPAGSLVVLGHAHDVEIVDYHS